MYVAVCVLVFLCCYALTIVLTSIGYHRALAHGAVRLQPWARRALIELGPWFTGFDAKAWVVMHRLHHQYSDTPQDPHSPVNVGLLGLFQAQYRGFVNTQQGLLHDDPAYASLGRDLELSWVARHAWWGPYAAQIAAGVVVGLTLGWGLGLALVAGLMSHVVQGAVINYFGHAHGGRNFDLDDNSRNNHPAAWLVLGEGFQNNHHRYPSSARFSYRPFEIDLGYGVCRTLQAFGILEIVQKTLMPRPA
ncbi:MAG: acyl-CoA desaturase [Deltaproteobacteria bacterium]|nr:acyl-CoA desaturase [Deltaproteobacteria bacterium]